MIAAVAVDVALPHLDRTFDYRVPEGMAVSIGVRVRVTFAGRLVTGIVLALHDDAAHATAEIRALVSPATVLTPAMAALVRAVADRYAGTFADVVRFAVAPRHARAETAALAAPLPPEPTPRSVEQALAVRGLDAFIARHARGEALAACLELPTGIDLESTAADLSAELVAHGSVIVVAPDARAVDALTHALGERGIESLVMRAGDGPAARQRMFTMVARSARCVVVGTRAAVFAPVGERGTTIVIGDGDDALVEPQAPGWHAREVALLRGHVQGWSTLLVAHHRSVEVAAHVADGSVRPLEVPRDAWRRASVRCEGVPERYDDADPLLHRLRIPPSAFRAMRDALRVGPVLVSVAQRGYVTAVRCAACREPARCTACSGPIGVAAEGAVPRCRWCGTAAWSCTWCGGTRVLFRALGGERTREELGRAFPDVPIRVVDAEHPLPVLPEGPHLLVVTPGAEPQGRAALGVILDVDTVLARHDLNAASEAVRRWLEVAAHVRRDGRVLVVGSPTAPAVQALVRADPAGFAERELAARRVAGLPPAVHCALVEVPAGTPAAREVAEGVADSRVLGPVVRGESERWLILHPNLEALRVAVRAMVVRRSAAKSLAGVAVRLDPLELAT